MEKNRRPFEKIVEEKKKLLEGKESEIQGKVVEGRIVKEFTRKRARAKVSFKNISTEI